MDGAFSKLELLLDKELQKIEKTTTNPIERYEKMIRASVCRFIP